LPWCAAFVSNRARSGKGGGGGLEDDLDRLGVAGVDDLIEGPEFGLLNPSKVGAPCQTTPSRSTFQVSNSTGFYPRIQVDTASSGAVGQAGGVLLTATIAASGLGPAMSDALSGWRKPLAVHDPAKVVLDLAVTLALGGDCLADMALLRPSATRRAAK